ncbi:MAG: hypothetical protein NDI61_08520 [Bdellovibrionaceae bacterium]|nr:hypothetical protein [Pseudobdellovibrionaceae bacterium]
MTKIVSSILVSVLAAPLAHADLAVGSKVIVDASPFYNQMPTPWKDSTNSLRLTSVGKGHIVTTDENGKVIYDIGFRNCDGNYSRFRIFEKAESAAVICNYDNDTYLIDLKRGSIKTIKVFEEWTDSAQNAYQQRRYEPIYRRINTESENSPLVVYTRLLKSKADPTKFITQFLTFSALDGSKVSELNVPGALLSPNDASAEEVKFFNQAGQAFMFFGGEFASYIDDSNHKRGERKNFAVTINLTLGSIVKMNATNLYSSQGQYQSCSGYNDIQGHVEIAGKTYLAGITSWAETQDQCPLPHGSYRNVVLVDPMNFSLFKSTQIQLPTTPSLRSFEQFLVSVNMNSNPYLVQTSSTGYHTNPDGSSLSIAIGVNTGKSLLIRHSDQIWVSPNYNLSIGAEKLGGTDWLLHVTNLDKLTHSQFQISGTTSDALVAAYEPEQLNYWGEGSIRDAGGQLFFRSSEKNDPSLKGKFSLLRIY